MFYAYVGAGAGMAARMGAPKAIYLSFSDILLLIAALIIGVIVFCKLITEMK